MIAYVIPVEGPVETIELDNQSDLKQLQAAVGGYIEAVPLPDFIAGYERASAYVNEEGKYTEPFNPRATDYMVPGVGLHITDHIAGTMVLVGFNAATGEHAELPQGVIERLTLINSEYGGTK